MNPKIIAMYLPQYHQIPENDAFWGKGFTDWVTVKEAQPLFEGHNQPRIPVDDNYYDLSLRENIVHQAELAKEYGVYGFGIYHYWFNDEKNLLTKPADIILENKDIDTHYFFAWDNISWKRSWSNVSGNDWSPVADKNNSVDNSSSNESGMLIEYRLGAEESWKKHFEWLLPHFRDERYIKVDGKPMFVIYHCSQEILAMCQYFDYLAEQNGFPGIYVVFRKGVNPRITKGQNIFLYEPSASSWDLLPKKIYRRVLKQLGIKYGPKTFQYDKVWKKLLDTMASHPEKTFIPSAFVGYDDTPRRGKYGTIIKGQTPEKFGIYLNELMRIVASQNKPYILLTAWNEWSEGAYLEPDTIDSYEYLKAVKNATCN